MPFAIRQFGDRWGVVHLSTGRLAGPPRYKSAPAAIATAKRWMEYRGETPYLYVSSEGIHVLAR